MPAAMRKNGLSDHLRYNGIGFRRDAIFFSSASHARSVLKCSRAPGSDALLKIVFICSKYLRLSSLLLIHSLTTTDCSADVSPARYLASSSSIWSVGWLTSNLKIHSIVQG